MSERLREVKLLKGEKLVRTGFPSRLKTSTPLSLTGGFVYVLMSRAHIFTVWLADEANN